MTKLIPEKTVEIWTAFALVDHLGPDTWIWSRTSYVDQDVWTPDLRKWFMLELKAPEDDANPFISIDLAQLNSYVDGYRRRRHPDVLYVLPDPPWRRPPLARATPPLAADPHVRRSFSAWSYVIPASHLQALLSHGPAKTSARIRCSANTVEYRSKGPGSRLLASATVPTLHSVLAQVRLCIEPAGFALRSPATLTVVRSDAYEPWILSLDRVQSAVDAMTEQRANHMLFVGW